MLQQTPALNCTTIPVTDITTITREHPELHHRLWPPRKTACNLCLLSNHHPPAVRTWLFPAPRATFSTSQGSYRRGHVTPPPIPDTWAENFESFERTNLMRETNGSFDSCNSCKRLGTTCLHQWHESKLPFVSHIEFCLFETF